MKLRAKVAIIILAVVLSFAGFNMIASFVAPDFVKAKFSTEQETNPNVLAKAGTTAHHSNLIKG